VYILVVPDANAPPYPPVLEQFSNILLFIINVVPSENAIAPPLEALLTVVKLQAIIEISFVVVPK
jgi:hypothetical protein